MEHYKKEFSDILEGKFLHTLERLDYDKIFILKS